MTVIDSSFLVAYCLEERKEEMGKIEEIIVKGAIAPHIIVAESANAILVSQSRGLITRQFADRALRAVVDIAEINLSLISELELIVDSFVLARENKSTVYDSLFIFLAKKMKVPLASFDEGQVKVASRLGVEIVKF